MNDRIERGHVCEHGIRWPHACQPCDDAAWERKKSKDRAWMLLDMAAGLMSRGKAYDLVREARDLIGDPE